jgi:UDP-N-acetylglucosamine acyltransferase
VRSIAPGLAARIARASLRSGTVPITTGVMPLAASIAASAKLGKGIKIGAYAVIGEEVELGDGCIVHPHAAIGGPSKFGTNNLFYPFSSIGGDPQDYTFRGERTELVAGDNNIFREYVTVSRGTQKGGGTTRLGNDNFLLAYSHVGHDCQIGSNTLFVNGATLAGHVTIEDFVTIGAFCPVHQFCRIGRYAYIGASTVITQDVPPFSKIVTERETKSFGINTIGLERKGFSPDRLLALKRAYRLLLRSKLNTSQALAEMRKTLADSPDVQELIKFIESAERGIVK